MNKEIESLISNLPSIISILLAFAYGHYQIRQAKKQSERQIRTAREQSEEANRLAGKAEKIANALSTRFRGHFPTYLKDVASLISGAEHSIRIMHSRPN